MSSNKEEKSALESLEHELYDPKAHVGQSEIHSAKAHRTLDLPTSWGNDAPIITKGEQDKSFSFGAKLFFISTILLFIALIFTAWRVVSLRNVVSANNIDMTADITPYIEGGESTPLVVTLRNRNTTALESATLTLLYKQGSGSQDEQEKVQEKREIGTIKSNEYKKQDFVVAIYGAESESRDITLRLEYKVAGSNAVFSKIATTSVVLRTPPISVSVNGPESLTVGQMATYTFVVRNNSATTSLPTTLQAIFPNSFTIESQDPKPYARTTSWAIESIPAGEEKKVTILGSFAGKEGEQAVISAKIGSPSDTPSNIGIVFSSQAKDIQLRDSPLTLAVALSSETTGVEALKYGDRATLTLTYKNTSTQALEDVSIKLALSGDAAIFDQINPTSGYYDSINKTITWDKATFPDLAVLAPNTQNTLMVIIPIVSRGNNSPSLKATYTGTASTKNTSDIVSTVTKSWVVQGSATVSASTQYKTSPFANTGPIPPQANKETTYAVHLVVSAQNALINTKVSFVLPAYVTWKNVYAEGSNVSYDTKTRTVSWNIGKLEAGKTVTTDVQVGVTPSTSHVNNSPSITSGIILDADEEVSRFHIKTTLSPLTTVLKNEAWGGNPSLVVP